MLGAQCAVREKQGKGERGKRKGEIRCSVLSASKGECCVLRAVCCVLRKNEVRGASKGVNAVLSAQCEVRSAKCEKARARGERIVIRGTEKPNHGPRTTTNLARGSA